MATEPREIAHSCANSFSVLPAISIEGILTVLIIEGSFNTALYLEFIELCIAKMNPFPEDNSVLVMDNCPIHMNARVREMVEARYVRYSLLSDYITKILLWLSQWYCLYISTIILTRLQPHRAGIFKNQSKHST